MMTSLTVKEITGRHVLLAMLSFFAVIIAVNIVFVWLAIDSFSGIETENAYQKGLRYNEVLQSAEAQNQLGWSTHLEHDGKAQLVRASFHDRYGMPITGMKVQVDALRPAHLGFDRDLVLVEVEPGHYEADVDLPLAGQWLLRMTAEQGEGSSYYLEKEIWLK